MHVMLRRLLRLFRSDRVGTAVAKSFLHDVRGVIHIGANRGQERDEYAASGLDVLWIEPIPDVFDELESNIRHLPRQRALRCLISDRDDKEYAFNISNNEGLSSSIFGLHQHKDIWPEVAYTRTMVLRSRKLSTVVRDERIDMKAFDALVIDTQGSELLVLKGAESILPHIKYIKAEAADFESYAGGCTAQELIDYLARFGFRVTSRHAFAKRAAGGTYFDLTFGKTAKAA
jgi:FkbM family methyltransferase